jgi:hypothetical protein
MALDREAIYAALFALTANVTWDRGSGAETFITRTRRLALFSDVPEAEQPWLGQAEHSEYSSQQSGMPYKHTLEASWMVYHRDGEQPGSVPTILGNLHHHCTGEGARTCGSGPRLSLSAGILCRD